LSLLERGFILEVEGVPRYSLCHSVFFENPTYKPDVYTAVRGSGECAVKFYTSRALELRQGFFTGYG